MAAPNFEGCPERLQVWSDRWDAGHTAFHRDDVHHSLQTHLSRLLQSAPSRVFVPLCGKTTDMPFLASLDAGVVSEVVGVEGVRKAVEELVEENPSLKFSLSDNVATSGDERLKVYVADFFQLPDIGSFEAAWDRGSFVAIDRSLCQAYADVMAKLMAPGGRILLDVFHYDQSVMQGPPFSVDAETVEKHFGSKFAIEKLGSYDAFTTHGMLRQVGLDACSEDVYLLTKRADE